MTQIKEIVQEFITSNEFDNSNLTKWRVINTHKDSKICKFIKKRFVKKFKNDTNYKLDLGKPYEIMNSNTIKVNYENESNMYYFLIELL